MENLNNILQWLLASIKKLVEWAQGVYHTTMKTDDGDKEVGEIINEIAD